MTVGLVVGAIAIPAGAVAATATLVSIRGNNHTAFVTPANQLRTASADPADFFNLRVLLEQDTGTCLPLGTPPTGQAWVIKSLTVSAHALATSGQAATLTTGANCDTPLQVVDISQRGAQTVTFGDGLVIPSGTTLSASRSNVAADVNVSGYSIPAGAATGLSLRTVSAKRH
jgi:hypothetical protein